MDLGLHVAGSAPQVPRQDSRFAVERSKERREFSPEPSHRVLPAGLAKGLMLHADGEEVGPKSEAVVRLEVAVGDMEVDCWALAVVARKAVQVLMQEAGKRIVPALGRVVWKRREEAVSMWNRLRHMGGHESKELRSPA